MANLKPKNFCGKHLCRTGSDVQVAYFADNLSVVINSLHYILFDRFASNRIVETIPKCPPSPLSTPLFHLDALLYGLGAGSTQNAFQSNNVNLQKDCDESSCPTHRG